MFNYSKYFYAVTRIYQLYRTLIRPVVTYAMETWTLNISDENAL
jgi:hypothetical protein